ncbi:SDR family oxidoreductase [Streptosporangium sp. 'caverna']|uniref:SDR family oxidoreductase n=1 Tax=Streptosporangium sp. 'caverna' TaxID=2202249 RepID=UPI000D7D3B72|nr:SDR family oxidoreductase [Streptosporangium sp. 'caverna']AWS47961.1 short-chain dehydrogenase [Streptosporangium sp. 'caverna']
MNGKRVVIIGGTSGLGFATAKAVAAEGASVVVASRSRGGVDRAVSTLPAGTEGHVVDITDGDGVRSFFDRLGAFDHLVYTAGEPLMNGTLAETDIEDVRRFFDIRYFGALTAVKYGAPHIRLGGSVVLTSGTASTRPLRGTTAVSSVLSAIEGLTRALSVELAPIRVNAVVPGIIRTEMWGGLPETDREAMYGALADTLLVGRRVGEPGDVAETYVYLMRNRHSTGSTITVDGGAVLV